MLSQAAAEDVRRACPYMCIPSALSGAVQIPSGRCNMCVSKAACLLQVGLYTISFGFGLGPIAWLVPAEIHDINTRAAGQSFTVFTQLLSGAIITQVFLKMLCGLQYWAFIFFGLWQAIACIFFIFLQPETNGIPIEQVCSRSGPTWSCSFGDPPTRSPLPLWLQAAPPDELM